MAKFAAVENIPAPDAVGRVPQAFHEKPEMVVQVFGRPQRALFPQVRGGQGAHGPGGPQQFLAHRPPVFLRQRFQGHVGGSRKPFHEGPRLPVGGPFRFVNFRTQLLVHDFQPPFAAGMEAGNGGAAVQIYTGQPLVLHAVHGFPWALQVRGSAFEGQGPQQRLRHLHPQAYVGGRPRFKGRGHF